MIEGTSKALAAFQAFGIYTSEPIYLPHRARIPEELREVDEALNTHEVDHGSSPG